MQKTPKTVAEAYLTQPRYTVLDVVSLLLTALSLVIFIIFFPTLWLSLPPLGFFMLFLISRSGHVSDKEYDGLLSHLLAFNSVREARSEGYEALLRFYEQGYFKKDAREEFTDFYLGGYDLSKGMTRRGEDGEPRGTHYRLTHLHFTDTHCLYYTCEADLLAGTVSEDRRIVPLDEGATLTEKTATVSGRPLTLRYLALPYCAPIPVGEENAELEEILSHFTKK